MCGQVAAVRALTSPAQSPHMTRAARRYWLGVAADRAGDRELAAAELRAAIATSRGRARRLAELALAQSERSEKVELSAEVAAVVEQTVAQPAIAWESSPRPWLTWLLCGSCAAVAVALSIAGSSTDVSTLVRAGATVRGLISDGQWWRLATSVFLHVGAVHVTVNVVSLWVIGRLAEDVFGKLRTAALFAVCGVCGAAASYFTARAGISAGASGAIFGLLGATFGELTRHRRHFAAAIRNGMWGALLVVAVATLAVGSQVPEIDQWAHVGGLGSGLVLGQLLSPRHSLGRFTTLLAWPLLAGFVVLLGWGAVGIARGDFATLMLGGPRITSPLGEAAGTPFGPSTYQLTAAVPHRWQLIDGELADPDIFAVLSAHVVAPAPPPPSPSEPDLPGGSASAGPPRSGEPDPVAPAAPAVDRQQTDSSPAAALDASEAMRAWFDAEPTRARERNFATARLATRPRISLPAPWQYRELELSAPDPLAGDQRYRVIAFARAEGLLLIVGSLYAPESLVDAAPTELAAIITSLRLQAQPPPR
jgi:membrane associated rhomboid family serine protease